jgi:hypothetical protein
MSVEGVKKAQEKAEEEVPLIRNKEFADFLVKEFKMPAGKARETAFRYPQDKKEVMVLLKEWMPKASFKSIGHILSNVSSDAISQRLRILEEHEIPPSRWFLEHSTGRLESSIKTLEENGIMKSIKEGKEGALQYLLSANQDYIKTNIQALKDRGRNVAEYARLYRLGDEPKKFNALLDHEDAIIKKLEGKMSNVSSEAVKKLVNRTHLQVIRGILVDAERQENLEELTDRGWNKLMDAVRRGRDIETLTDSSIATLGLSRKKFWEAARKGLITELVKENPTVPRESIEKAVSEVHPNRIRRNMEVLEKKGMKLADLVDIGSLAMRTDKFEMRLAQEYKESLGKALNIRLVDEKLFYKLIDRFPPDEKEAFIEMGETIKNKGRMTHGEMQEIFGKHVTGEDTEIRLNKRVNSLVDKGAWDIEVSKEKLES